MATPPRAVFLDVDGTYLNDRGVVPQSAREAVIRARANGHLVFVCTGRSTAILPQHVLEAGFDGVIASAGGYVEIDGEVLARHTVPIEYLRLVVEYFDARAVDYFFEANSGLYGSGNALSRVREMLYGARPDGSVLAAVGTGLSTILEAFVLDADLIRDDIAKISILSSAVPIEEIRAEFAGIFDLVPATVSRFGPNSGEMSLRGVHKAKGIEVVLEHLGLDRSDTIAFGDGFNDLEMLEFVRVGVAMGNAPARVIDAADHVTDSPDADGIWNGFRAHGLL